MLQAVIRLLGADYGQWRALTRVALKLDLRGASLGTAGYQQAGGQGTNAVFQIILRFGFYLIFGVFLASLVVINQDAFFTGTVLISYTMIVVALLILVDFGAVVISPDDFVILGPQPVSSRTYFIARLTNVLVYSSLLTLTLGILPAGAYFFVRGFHPLLGLAALCANWLAGLATTLLLVSIYAGILRVVHPRRLRRAVGYIQLAMSFLIYGGYMILPGMVKVKGIGSMSLVDSNWLFLVPSTWFASYLKLADGHGGGREVFLALLSLAVLAVLAIHARGRLALDYADRLSAAMAVSEGPAKASKAPAGRGMVFRRGESRAVALLVRNQFQYDLKFRLAVLSILPLTVIYLFMGLRNGPLSDPLAGGGKGFSNSLLLNFAVLMFPMMLRGTLAYSDSYQASWIYFATPADRSRLVLAAKNFVFCYFVFPYLAVVGALMLYFIRNPWHVALHLGVLAILSHIFQQVAVFFSPLLPFSLPTAGHQRSGAIVIAMVAGPIAAMVLLYVLALWVYPNPVRLWGTVAGIVAISYLAEKGLQARLRRQLASFEYKG